jgi:hypothetical protein
MNELKPTPASEIKKMRLHGVVLTLFSGRAIQMRSADPSHFVKDEDFTQAPIMFREFILDTFWAGDYRAKVDAFLKRRETPQETADFATSLGIVAKKVLIKPIVVDVPQTDDDEDEIALSDLQIEELVLIFRLAFESQKVLYYLEEHGLDSGNEEPGQAADSIAADEET